MRSVAGRSVSGNLKNAFDFSVECFRYFFLLFARNSRWLRCSELREARFLM